MRRNSLIPILFFILTGLATAQNGSYSAFVPAEKGLPPLFLSAPDDASALPSDETLASLTVPVTLPRMAPELAVQAYRTRVSLQTARLSSYSASTVIRASLVDTKQYGEYELQRNYSAPNSLAFKAVRFSGDNFVKSNVILRLLQSEVDHVQKDDPTLTAISPANYKFSYKGLSQVAGRAVYVYQLKPRKKRSGLFKGRIYLDPYSGSLVRAEGTMAKSPSLFIKKILFEQDYADIGSFTFPVSIHSEAQTRIVGRAIVDIVYSHYQPVASVVQAQVTPVF
ncbi:MAG: hypothetical protein WB952_04340 [Terriglobales bacterium]